MNRMVTNLHFDRKKVFMDYEISWTTRFINNHFDFGVRDTTVLGNIKSIIVYSDWIVVLKLDSKLFKS